VFELNLPWKVGLWYYTRTHNYERTILIPTLGIRSTDYDIDKDRQLELFLSAAKAAVEFF